jgi:DnaJ domain
MAESFHTIENPVDEIENLRHYSVLNVPRTADLSHIQRSFKQLSRVYHPDKSIADKHDVAQQSFIAIKTAVDVLSDPIYRIAYDHGGDKAVSLVKRAQMARQARKASQPENDDNNTENDFDDLYSMLEQAVDEQEAAWIIHQVLEESLSHSQRGMSISQWDLSCEVPLTWKETTAYSGASIEKDSVFLNAHVRYPISSQVGLSLGAGSEYQHSAETNIKGSIGCDYQPIQGTSITTNIACNHRKAPELSVNSSRKFANGSVMVVAAHGSVTSAKSWNASFISSRPILLDSLFSRVSSSSLEPSKLMASWRIICNPVGTLRIISTTLRSLEYPVWSCRLAMSNYPFKVSWQGAETNSFYAAISLGMHFPRIKLLRISSFGNQWKLKYGLKHDVQAFLTKGSLWSIICSLQSNELSIRIPVNLESTSPVAWIASILFAEFVDQRLKQFQWSGYNESETETTVPKRGTMEAGTFPMQSLVVVQKVASKKRELEAAKEDGLVILEATLCVEEATFDVADALQFWVVDSKLNVSIQDPRLFGQVTHVHSYGNESHQPNTWINSLFGFGMRKTKDTQELMKTSLVVRYQHRGNTYHIDFADCQGICLPNEYAAELGPSSRVR